MTEDDWLAVIARVGVAPDALRLSDMSRGPDRTFALRGPSLGPSGGPDVAPSRMLWPRDGADAATATIGVTILSPIPDAQLLALQLASFAIERGLMPVILTTRDETGLEPYGLRIERLSDVDGHPDEREMAELAAFWDFALVIDAADIALLG